MPQTAEERLARDISKACGIDIYGLHNPGNINGPLRWLEIYNRYMIIRVLEDEPIDDFLTDDEQAELEGLIIIKS
jgi:hypothetical protein